MADEKKGDSKKINWQVILPMILIILVIVIAFDLQPRGTSPVNTLDDKYLGIALYICPANESVFHSISDVLSSFLKYKNMLFTALMLGALLSLLYTLYISFIKNKFAREEFNTPIKLFQMFFWFIVISNLLFLSPNHYKQVWYVGNENERISYDVPYVLCENTDPDSIPVGYNSISTKKKLRHE